MSESTAASAIARWTSILLHPFAVFAALSLVAAWQLDPASLPRTAVGIAVAVAVVWSFVLQRRRSGRWGTVDASDRKERPILYALVLVVAAAYWLWLGGRASPTGQGVVAVIAMLCVAGIANRWIKLSLHMAFAVFAAWLLRELGTIWTLAALLFAVAVAWSRLALRRHEPRDLVAGAIAGTLAGAAFWPLAARWMP